MERKVINYQIKQGDGKGTKSVIIYDLVQLVSCLVFFQLKLKIKHIKLIVRFLVNDFLGRKYGKKVDGIGNGNKQNKHKSQEHK